MGKRRNSLIILAVVVVLLGVSAWVLTDKPTVLGLDLQGRHGARLPGSPDAAGPGGDAGGHRPRDRDHPRARRLARRLRAGDLPGRPGPDRDRAAERLERQTGGRFGRDHGAAPALRLRAERDPAQAGDPGSGGAPVQPALRRGARGVQAAGGLRGAVRQAEVHRERQHLLPLRREHARPDRRAVRDAEGPLREPAAGHHEGGHQGARRAARDGRARGQARRRPDDIDGRVRRARRSSSSCTTSPA